MKNINFSGLACFNVKSSFSVSELSKEYRFLILESNQTPDYYSKQNFPPNADAASERSLYLLVKNQVNCFQDLVLRHAAILSQKFQKQLHIYPGQIVYQAKPYQCIKIDTNDAGFLAEIIKLTKILNIDLVKVAKKVPDYETLLFYKKYIELNEISEGIYRDADNSARYFFLLPRNIEFAEFEQKIEAIKNNCNFHLFDAFLSQLFFKDRVYDFAGIYSQHCDETRLAEFKSNIDKIFR